MVPSKIQYRVAIGVREGVLNAEHVATKVTG